MAKVSKFGLIAKKIGMTSIPTSEGGFIPVTLLKIDGGVAQNNFLTQFQADVLGVTLERPKMLDATAQGAAFGAGLTIGFWTNYQQLVSDRPVERIVEQGEADDDGGRHRQGSGIDDGHDRRGEQHAHRDDDEKRGKNKGVRRLAGAAGADKSDRGPGEAIEELGGHHLGAPRKRARFLPRRPEELPAEMDYDCEICCRPLILIFDESGAYARGLGE